MVIESKKYEGFFEIAFANGSLVNRDGIFIDKISGKQIKTWLDKHNGYFTVSLKHNGSFLKIGVHQVLAKIFIVKPIWVKGSGRELVDFRDADKTNFSLENLYWINDKDFQIKLGEERRTRQLKKIKYPESAGVWPNPTPCPLKDGYYYIPNTSSPVVINRSGKLFNLIKNKRHKTRLTKKGYVVTNLWDNDKGVHRNYIVHRLVAVLFVPIPERHREKQIEVLQVNHRDGVKIHNWESNLEWVDNDENMRHARENCLFSTEKVVLAKDIRTGAITRFQSIAMCSRHFDLAPSPFFFHLKEKRSAGRITKKWHVFKLDDGGSWPDLIVHECSENTHKWTCNVFMKNINDGRAFVFTHMAHACDSVGLNINSVKNHLARKGESTPYGEWIFSIGEGGFED